MSFLDKLNSTLTPTSIDDLKSRIRNHGGVARSNRFNVIITPPTQTLLNLDIQGHLASAMSGSFRWGSLINDPRDISILCESCSFPGRQIQTLDYSDLRNPRKVPNAYFNEDITCNFHLTNDYYIKKIFEKWQAAIINPEDYTLNYDDEFKSDIIIQQLNTKNIVIYGIRLLNAYPTGLNSVELNNNDTDTHEKLSVTFTYDDFQPEGAITSLLGGISQNIGGLTRII